MTRRTGLTHVELITVSAVIVLVLATLAPAMQQARDDARVNQCKQNLRGLGLALHNYHDVYTLLPPGWVSRDQTGEGHLSTGWQSSLLPYVGQSLLYQKFNFSIGESPVNQDQFKTVISAYLCPLDSAEGVNRLRGGWGASSYSGNYGARPIPRWTGSTGAESFWPGQIATLTGWPNGIFHVNSRVGIRDITDGTSNTVFVGERSAIGGGGIWFGVRSNYLESDAVSDGSFGSPFNASDTGFSSRHRGQLMFLLGDGSVRAISASLQSKPDATGYELGMLQKLCGRDDGNPLHEAF